MKSHPQPQPTGHLRCLEEFLGLLEMQAHLYLNTTWSQPEAGPNELIGYQACMRFTAKETLFLQSEVACLLGIATPIWRRAELQGQPVQPKSQGLSMIEQVMAHYRRTAAAAKDMAGSVLSTRQGGVA